MRIDANALTSNIAKMLSVHGNGAFSAAAGAGAGKARAADSAAFSPKSQSLGQIGALLGRLSAAVRNIGATPDGIRGAHADIKGIEASIESALSQRDGSGVGFETSWVSGAVNRHTISQLDLEPGEELEVDVRVTQSAQQGGMYLSLGGEFLNLGGSASVTSSFTIRVAGVHGVRQFTFASGQTMGQIAAAINTFGDTIGVEATAMASGTKGGIMLQAQGYGAADFVSVSVVATGSIGTAHNVGIYRLQHDNANEVDASSHIDYNSSQAANGYERVGQDVRGYINGVYASGYGTRLYAAMPAFAVSIDLATDDLEPNEVANATHLGRFVAMRFTGVYRDQNHTGGNGDDPGWAIPR